MQVMIRGRMKHFRTVEFDLPSREVRLIEQRLPPHEFRVIGTRDFFSNPDVIRGYNGARRNGRLG